jgi:hypothetical protein
MTAWITKRDHPRRFGKKNLPVICQIGITNWSGGKYFVRGDHVSKRTGEFLSKHRGELEPGEQADER